MTAPCPPGGPCCGGPARAREGRSPAARWLQLASVAPDGTPRVRTPVFRGWPPPGRPHMPEAGFPAELADGTPLPPHFQLLRIAIGRVDLLELGDHPHRRRRWRNETGWQEERLNP